MINNRSCRSDELLRDARLHMHPAVLINGSSLSRLIQDRLPGRGVNAHTYVDSLILKSGEISPDWTRGPVSSTPMTSKTALGTAAEATTPNTRNGRSSHTLARSSAMRRQPVGTQVARRGRFVPTRSPNDHHVNSSTRQRSLALPQKRARHEHVWRQCSELRPPSSCYAEHTRGRDERSCKFSRNDQMGGRNPHFDCFIHRRV